MRQFLLFSLLGLLSISTSCSQGSRDGSVQEVTKIHEYNLDIDKSNYQTAVLAGGCFWCTEAAFHRIDGVIEVISGYAGGGDEKPNYKGVCSGRTKFAEAIYIYYDESVIDYETLLDVFFIAHNPTQLNRQGNDVGPQYRSAVFYQNEAQKSAAQNTIKALSESEIYSNPIVTTLEPYDLFWTAESYHQNFYELNPNQSYVSAVSRPKVEKVMKVFKSKLKSQYKPK